MEMNFSTDFFLYLRLFECYSSGI